MAQDKRQETQPETPMETQPELQPVDALRDSRRKLTRSIVVTVVLVAVAALAVFEGVTLGWLSNPNRNVDANETDIQSAGVTEQDGHDTYKFDVNLDKGICINDDVAVTMNAYDKELPKRNERTPIILRAVLSSSHSTTEKLSLKITCASKELKQETLTADTAAQYNSQLSNTDWKAGDKINWLSNVVNVRAGYIPGLQTRAVAGTYEPYTAGDTTKYKDADDYIYNYAVDFFRAKAKTETNPNGIEPVTFISEKSIEPTVEYTEWSAGEWQEASSASEIGKAPDPENQGSDENGNPIIKEYKLAEPTQILIYNQQYGQYLYLNGSGQVSATQSKDTAEANPWTLSASGSGYKMSCNGRYLTVSGGSLATTNNEGSAVTWSFGDNGGKLTISCVSGGTTNYYLDYYYNYWNASAYWRVSTRISSGGRQTVSQKVQYRTYTTKPGMTVAEKIITVNVDLAGAKEADDGRYYVYLMFDYDHELVNKYLTDNGISLKLGDENIQFTDAFQIAVVETPTT